MGDRYGPLTAVDLACRSCQPLGSDRRVNEIRFRSLQIAGEICGERECRQAAVGLTHRVIRGRGCGTEPTERIRGWILRSGEGSHDRLHRQQNAQLEKSSRTFRATSGPADSNSITDSLAVK